ncbi:signal peptide peptidase SppA [Winogradskyella sp.]|uniref:signal peptide peptidase SppA n=1 Tax=Winogradskyella sp. TaxID=1883156 RepID=UPI002618A0F8|nr:signal peptide peptidase SppA [Winogradskyella sp.]
MSFFKRVLSTIVGLIIFSILGFILFLIVIAFVGSQGEEPIIVDNNSVLNLKLDFEIEDHIGKKEFKDYTFLNEYPKHSLFGMIKSIEFAKTDPKIKGIIIENNLTFAGYAQLKALRDALIDFKDSGKFIVSYSDIYTQQSYYLSSAADTMYVNPSGTIEFKGLASQQYYFKDFQEKTGLKMEVVRHGKYKSAVEPFLENNMSAANREQIESYLNSIWSTIKTDISQSRSIPSETLNTIADSLLGRTPTLALENKLVDRVGYYDEFTNDIKHQIGIMTEDELPSIDIRDYSEYTYSKRKSSYKKDKIAVIFAEGDIIYGEGNEDFVGQGIINKSLKEAREDDKVKAVVLRVNSPGGSALTSELIWREIELTKKVKPVVVSMGNYAASGGYYIASNADYIVAEPMTVTGSIGVFGILPNGTELFEKWGISTHQVTTNTNAITYSFSKPLSVSQREYIKEGIIDVYDLFLTRVAQGRGMSKDDVNTIAQGRVWTGSEAIKVGLVDELGGLDTALEKATELANIDNYAIKEFPVFQKDFMESLGQLGLMKTKEELLKEELGEEGYKVWKDIKTQTQREGVQLLFPYGTHIE